MALVPVQISAVGCCGGHHVAAAVILLTVLAAGGLPGRSSAVSGYRGVSREEDRTAGHIALLLAGG
jgi:hypothetical protein